MSTDLCYLLYNYGITENTCQEHMTAINNPYKENVLTLSHSISSNEMQS